MSKSGLINSASDNANNETEESETSDGEYLSDLSKAATVHVRTLCFERVRERKLPRKRIIRFSRRH